MSRVIFSRKKLKVLSKVGRTGFRRFVFGHVLVKCLPLRHKRIAPNRVRIEIRHPAVAVIFGDEEPDRRIPDVRRIVLYPDHLLFSVHLEVSVETRDPVNAGFELTDEWAVIEGRGQVQTAAALRRKKHLVWHTQQFAHRGKVVAA